MNETASTFFSFVLVFVSTVIALPVWKVAFCLPLHHTLFEIFNFFMFKKFKIFNFVNKYFQY